QEVITRDNASVSADA
ncbi:hypothetical protein ACNVD4_17855, partial [Rhizobium sp. BR5]